MVTQQPLWKQFMALVSCLGQITSANTNSGRLKAVSKHPKGWTKWKSCMQVWGASGGEQCLWGKLPLLLCWLCVPMSFLSFLGLPTLLLPHSLNSQEMEEQCTTQRLVCHEPSASSLLHVWPPQEMSRMDFGCHFQRTWKKSKYFQMLLTSIFGSEYRQPWNTHNITKHPSHHPTIQPLLYLTCTSRTTFMYACSPKEVWIEETPT